MSIKETIATMLSKRKEVKLAILFGSVSRGEAGVNSDLDIAIACHHKLSVAEKESLIESLAKLSGRPIDLIDLQQSQEPIFSKALTTGELIYCTDRKLYAELIKRMIYNQADFIPLRAEALTKRRLAWINS